MSNISGGIPFAGLVSPTDSSDTYAVTDENTIEVALELQILFLQETP